MIGQHIRNPVFWSISLMGVLVAAATIDLADGLIGTLVSIVISVLIFLWMLFAVRASKLLLSAASQRAELNAIVRVVLDDGAGLRGKVTHIGIRSTRLLTRDDVEVTIPNSIMGNSKVVNE